jgi:CubicO group peptidase (beta-lactamase class C family)
MELAAAPLTQTVYSDLGFILLGQALERLAGDKLDILVSREILSKIGMTNTMFRPPAQMQDQIPPTEADFDFRKRIIQGEVQDENCWVLGGIGGHAGLFSNVPDLLNFADRMLGGDNGLFRPETVEIFTTRQLQPPGSSRALGWDTPADENSSSGHLFSKHSAGHLGFAGTSLWIDFHRQIAVVLLTNRCWPSRENQAIRALRPLFHDAVLSALRR